MPLVGYFDRCRHTTAEVFRAILLRSVWLAKRLGWASMITPSPLGLGASTIVYRHGRMSSNAIVAAPSSVFA